jgi:glycogen debranching enzyme
VLGEARFAAECWAQAARAGAAIEGDFYDEERGSYALDLRPDGARSWTQTALHAVPVLLGAANPVRARGFLDAVAGEGFSAPWGVRLVPTGDPHFNPKGYHSGAVWPLFTGWAALAEYRAGRGGAAFRHLDANVRLAFARQRGAFDEVLHGLEERAAGVCPNQAWSAAMVIAPLVEGLLGAVPDAPGGKLTLAPQLPEQIGWLEIVGLRCGESVLDLKISRRASLLAVAVRRAMGPPLWLTVAPWCEVVPSRVEVDGQQVKPDLGPWGGGNRSAVSFQASAEHEVRFTLE